ncbi:hypothetical protein GXW78_07145 [Roseomonas terrae]|uniref:Uncharacterized protein n=1 Tax=Neoroseomonas terrae TaxID=424799 RepID=A0ABS5EEJ3_9PROT|nr:hypothetical protein [Neoroseomonas terrae]MBR0649433.1 hypothetical protein [Neoroseomonas terrae]
MPLVAWIALLGVLPLAQARAQRSETVALVMPDGRCVVRIVSAETIAAATAAMGRAAEDSGALMQRLAADAAAARFAAARERVPAFGAWAFDWVQSYINSFRMLGAMLRSVADSAAEGDVVRAEALVQRMAAPMRFAFHQRVLAPAGMADGLATDAAHAAAMLEIFWARGLTEAVRPILDARAGSGPATAPRLDLATAVRGVADDLAAAVVPVASDSGVEPGSDPTSVLTQSMRPMAARLSAVALRASEAGSLLAAGGALGFAMGGASGFLIGTAGGIGAYWAIDWGLNRVDSALNRADFEARALDAIARAEAAFVAGLDGTARAAIAVRLPSVTTQPAGCPLPVAGR